MIGHLTLPDPTDLDGLRQRLTLDADGVGGGDGHRRAIGMRRVRIGAGVLAHLVEDVAEVRRDGPVVVVMDRTPIRRGGSDLKAYVLDTLSERFEVRPVLLGRLGVELHADEATVADADTFVEGAGCVVSVGSGTITDIAKDASLRAGNLPFVVVQTAVSVNAFSDDMAVLLRDGVKRTLPSRWPDVLLVDLDVLADTPVAMNLAGVGELCSMFTAPADWYLANAFAMDDTFDPEVVALFRDGADAWLAGTARMDDPAMLGELAARMTLTGIAMGVAGRTAPLSGTEHLLSHLLDMAAGHAGRPLAFHGAQVGVASVLAATIWHDTLERFDPARLTLDATYPEDASIRGRVRAAFDPIDPTGRMADECWRDVRRKLERWRTRRPGVAAVARDWDRHRAALRDLVATPDDLRAALGRAGAAARIADLDPPAPAAVVRWAVASLPLMRDRFTVADLCFLAGTWDDATTKDLVGRSGILDGAA